METNKDFMFRNIAGQSLLIVTGETSRNFNGMIEMNETASFIWNQIDNCNDVETIINSVVDYFDIDEQTARKDVIGVIKELIQMKMISISDEELEIKINS